MLLRIFFWIIACYFLYKFIFGFVIPVIMATRNVRSKMKDMRQHMGEFEGDNSSSNMPNETFTKKEANTSSAKGDYIDFEEIK